MITNIINYFGSLNTVGQILFIIGVLLVLVFIILLIVVLKPEKNNVKKIYGESPLTDKEMAFEEKMKNIDEISDKDINIENDKTRNLKHIVDELKILEQKNNESIMDKIQKYEDDQENTAIISVEELLKANKPFSYEKPVKKVEPKKDDFDDMIIDEEDTKEIKIVGILDENKEVKPIEKREVFSSVFSEPKKEENNDFLKNLKEFRNNL